MTSPAGARPEPGEEAGEEPGEEPGGRTAAVVVNYESGALLESCLGSVVAEHPAETVVVDNGSADGSTDGLAVDFAQVTVVRPGRNLGYGAAANRGVAATSAELVLVCNPDLTVSPGAVSALVSALDRAPDAAVAGPLVRTPEGDRYPSARRFPSLVDAAGHAALGLFRPDNRFTRRYHEPSTDRAEGGAHGGGARAGGGGARGEAYRVDWVSGACFMARRDAFESVGGFDERFFMYAEDVDLCWRLREAGWSSLHVPAAEVVHHQGASTARHPERLIVEHHRSLLRFAAASNRGWRALLLPVVAAGIAMRAVIATLREVGSSRMGSRGPSGAETGAERDRL